MYILPQKLQAFRQIQEHGNKMPRIIETQWMLFYRLYKYSEKRKRERNNYIGMHLMPQKHETYPNNDDIKCQ